jgi:hypothetical protein
MGILRILDQTGDTMIEWRTDDPASVAGVRAQFDQLVRAEKWHAFARDAGARADDATLVRDFDETAEEIVLTRPLMGG